MTQSISHLHKQALQALNNKQYQQAHGLLIAILQQDKYFADAYFLLGVIASEHGNNEKGIQLFEQALKIAEHFESQSQNLKESPTTINKIEYLAHLAKAYSLIIEPIKAKHYADLTTQEIDKTNSEICNQNNNKHHKISSLTLDTLGVAYSKIGLHNQAVPLFEQAIEFDENNPNYYFNLGTSQVFIGDFEGAQHSHEKVIQLAPSFTKSYTALSALGKVSSSAYNLASMEMLFEKLIKADEKLHIGHAIAREYEALNDYDNAFKYLSVAKQAKLDSINYNFADDKAMFESLFDSFAKTDFLETGHFQEQKTSNSEAIFIVGMPRSGTTLVERILSQHSDVTTAGELEYFSLLMKKMSQTTTQRILDKETIEAAQQINFEELGKAYIDKTRVLTGGTAKFIDKMPLNILYAGFILKALPKAKIICLDRSPLDTIMSNFRQLFSANSYNYNYAYSLETTAQYYRYFKKLADFWLEKHPDNFYQINYQELVNEPELHAKKLVEFCELDWQQACLHINSNAAPVATASAIQVRQPINNKSIDNWKKYDKYLSEVKSIINRS
ncbi:sulfotransferase [Pseudocolwellia sp. AS88]|uniref:tetratricopeptide repeat-containing sulfotransferase family protein n=1 Tax=Pseudocolwellia sp. AS88 TaxID=3063958 RepID=UPI0026EBA761|nr:tetratricopeptide repeat-containing sulfotransferase family protein [Pseudocolwellia sp. AS88]MDO7085756.1 sulfotransferase [Pseudocolwellia sp. AS88]